MRQKEIILIADFDKALSKNSAGMRRNDTGNFIEDYELNYDSDWNLLMRIVEQIQDIDITPTPDYKGYRIEIVPQGYVQIEGSGMQTIFKNVAIEGSLIKTVYAAVIQFIKWHNSQPK